MPAWLHLGCCSLLFPLFSPSAQPSSVDPPDKYTSELQMLITMSFLRTKVPAAMGYPGG